MNKNTKYEREWNILRLEFERANLDDEGEIGRLKSGCSQLLKSAVDDQQEYWTLDRPQPIGADTDGDRLLIRTKSDRWYSIPEHTIEDAYLGILLQEADNIRHHTPMLIDAGPQASYIIGLHNCLLGRPIAVTESWLA